MQIVIGCSFQSQLVVRSCSLVRYEDLRDNIFCFIDSDIESRDLAKFLNALVQVKNKWTLSKSLCKLYPGELYLKYIEERPEAKEASLIDHGI